MNTDDNRGYRPGLSVRKVFALAGAEVPACSMRNRPGDNQPCTLNKT